jgi:hypothetical protein
MRSSLKLSFLLISITFPPLLLGSEQPNQKPPVKQISPTQQQPLADTEIKSPPPKQPNGDKANRLDSEQWYLWGMLATNVVLAFFTLILTLIGRSQARTAKRSADTARKSADIAALGQRAQLYACPRKDNALELTYGGLRPTLILEVKNVGITPAYKCTFDRWVAVVDEPFNHIFQDPTFFKDPKGVVIFPKEAYPPGIEIPFPSTLSQQELVDWRNGKKELWFRVRFEYEDVFKVSRFVDLAWAYINGRTENPRMLPQYHDAN